MRIKRSSIAFILTVAVLLTACNIITDIYDQISDVYVDITDIVADMPPTTPAEIPPFVITKPVFETIERTNHFKYAGIVFKFLNMTDKYIDKITVSFMLFDPKTQSSPFITTNKFEISKWDFVFPNENKEIIISFDKYIHIAPTEPYLIDFFYISEIHYLDGAVWQDKNGKYRVRGIK